MKIRISGKKFFEIIEEASRSEEAIKEWQNNDVEKLKCSCGGEFSHFKYLGHNCYVCNKCGKAIIRHNEN